MAKFGLPGGRRTRQPQQAVGIDKTNPLSRGLVEVFNPLSLTNRTELRGYTPSISAGVVTPSVGQLGRNIVLPTGTLDAGLIIAADGDDLFPSTTDATIFVVRRSLDTTARDSSLFGYTASDTDRVSTSAPWSNGILYFDFGGTAAAQRIDVAFAKSTSVDYLVFVAGGGKGREVWRNGIKIAGDTAKNGSRAATAANFRIGSQVSTVASDGEEIYLFGISNRAWSDIEIASWTKNPWQIFKPRKRELYVKLAGGVTAAITGQAITVGLGSTSAAITAPLTGFSLPAGLGSVSAAVSYGLTGQGVPVSVGNVTPGLSHPVTGQGLTASLGSFSAAVAPTLSGQSITVSVGDVVVAGGPVARTLSGQGLTLSLGIISTIWTASATPNGTWTDSASSAGVWTDKPLSSGTWTTL